MSYPCAQKTFQGCQNSCCNLNLAITFANSVFLGLDTLGKETFCYNFLVHDLDKLGMKRSQKSSRTNKKIPDAVEPIIPGVHQEKLPDSVDFENVSNENG